MGLVQQGPGYGADNFNSGKFRGGGLNGERGCDQPPPHGATTRHQPQDDCVGTHLFHIHSRLLTRTQTMNNKHTGADNSHTITVALLDRTYSTPPRA